MLVTGYVLVGLVAAGIIYIGLNYVFAPAKIAEGFGLRTLPQNGDAFYNIKGVRDIGTSLVPIALMLYGDPHALALVILAEAFIPFGDMLIILRHKGKKAVAFGVHGATAVVMVLASVLLLVG
ncbi:DUF4267 domain-containing protein [Amycolatopsis samaneae]|uniref:DUF4267 domain-containing protein n=1 Tax=Amycolatopsis samaneae TaxID=664691 RepID=A0ABW5GPI8_9PSEU